MVQIDFCIHFVGLSVCILTKNGRLLDIPFGLVDQVGQGRMCQMQIQIPQREATIFWKMGWRNVVYRETVAVAQWCERSILALSAAQLAPSRLVCFVLWSVVTWPVRRLLLSNILYYLLSDV